MLFIESEEPPSYNHDGQGVATWPGNVFALSPTRNLRARLRAGMCHEMGSTRAMPFTDALRNWQAMPSQEVTHISTIITLVD